METWLFQLIITSLWIGIVPPVLTDRGDVLGCYNFKIDNVLNTHTGQSVDVCLSACELVYYKYALIGNGSTCFCSNYPGEFKVMPDQCNTPCPKNSTQKCGGETVVSVYDTDINSPGPVTNLTVLNTTETTIRIHWQQPQAFTIINQYIVAANVLHSFNDKVLKSLMWIISNSSTQYNLLNLNPGTKYEINVAAVSDGSKGPSVGAVAETVIGTPDPSPPEVQIKEHKGDKMVIHIPPAVNMNGPISFYRIVVAIEVFQQGYIPENLGDYTSATEEGLPYYITAEIGPKDIENDFIIGDGVTYNGYYNAPLPLTKDIDVEVGVVSIGPGTKKVRYAGSSRTVVLNINEPEQYSPLVIALGAGIAIGVVLLLIGIGLVIIFKKKIYMARLQRGSQSMPLSLSEPCIEIENAGFLQDEDVRVDYYGNLKRKLWNIPRNLIDIDIACVAGMGTYGKFTRGKVQQHGAQTLGLVQVIADSDMDKPDKRLMLQELDALIKTSEHENVISLMGICETSTTLFVVLQDYRETLKELLLSCRHRDVQNNKFSLIEEARVVQICVDVLRGMEFLHSKKINHKRLCCRNIVMGDGGIPKVGGFGLSHIHPLNESPDYTRWTACEMFRQNRYNPKADVWSFGCLLWEAFTIGGTLYPQTQSKDVPGRVMRGMRPTQPSYVGDDLFQLCLQCWQVDMDERPTFTSLRIELEALMRRPVIGNISFTYFNDFVYAAHIPHFEIIS